MEDRQKQVMESYVRVKAFVDAHPLPEGFTYGSAKARLDAVVERLHDFSATQVLGGQTTKAQQALQRTLAYRLREHHMRPLVAIAQDEIAGQPGIQHAMQIPKDTASVTRLLAAAEAMAAAVEQYQPVFVAADRPKDFLEQLKQATAALRASVNEVATRTGTRVGARAGLAMEIRRGRRAVNRLHTVVKVAFENDPIALAWWKNAKRVRALPATPLATPLATGGTADENLPAAA